MARKPGTRSGVVRRQVNRRTVLGEESDRVQCCLGNVLIWTDAVHPTGEHQFLVVRRVSSEKERDVAVPNQDRDMICCVATRRDGNNVASLGEDPENSNCRLRAYRWCARSGRPQRRGNR